MGFTEYLCGNLGTLQLCRELGVTAHGSFSLNIANTPALEFFGRLGLESAELSFELSGREISGLGTGVRRGVMAYGRQALMLTRNCPWQIPPGAVLDVKPPAFSQTVKGPAFRLYAG